LKTLHSATVQFLFIGLIYCMWIVKTSGIFSAPSCDNIFLWLCAIHFYSSTIKIEGNLFSHLINPLLSLELNCLLQELKLQSYTLYY